MFDPIPKVCLTASLAQFLILVDKTLSETRATYESSEPEPEQTVDPQAITENLKIAYGSIAAGLENVASNNQVQDDGDKLQRLCADCKDIADGLLEALEKLAPLAPWTSFRRALSTLWAKEDIGKLQTRLLGLKEQVVSMSLSDFGKGIAVMDKVELAALDVAVCDATGLVGKEFLDYITDTAMKRNALNHWNQLRSDAAQAPSGMTIVSPPGVPLAEILKSPVDISRSLENMQHQRVSSVLELLGSEHMWVRHNEIAKAYRGTFEWIFQEELQEPWSSFTRWLQDDQPQTHPIYWITGKPGSGKSVLMKFVEQHTSTNEILRQWAGRKTLIKAGFWFRDRDSDPCANLHQSQEGLIRTLLFTSLNQCHELIPFVLPMRWKTASLSRPHQDPLTLDELEKAFQSLLSEGESKYNFAFFVDGLDEFDGDCHSLIGFLNAIAHQAHVKICVSSRPWPEYEDAFQDCPSLTLQYLTSGDIKEYTDTKLSESEFFRAMRRHARPMQARLVERVTARASGVFLWVSVIVDCLLQGLEKGDQFILLKVRMDSLPDQLKDLYCNLFNSIETDLGGTPKDRRLEEASRILQIVHTAEETEERPLSLLELYHAFKGDESYVLNHPNEILGKKADDRAEEMRRLLMTRCNGLLEAVPHNWQDRLADNRVQYLHPTVKDFLWEFEVSQHILGATKIPFRPKLSLCRAHIMTIKTGDSHTLTRPKFWTSVLRCIQYALEANKEAQKGADDNTRKELSKMHIGLLTQLDEAAIHLSRMKTQIKKVEQGVEKTEASTYLHMLLPDAPPGSHWSRAFCPRTCNSFLHFAVRLQLKLYVDDKIKDGLPPAEESGDLPLLYPAVMVEQPHLYITQLQAFPRLGLLGYIPISPNLRIVRSLLERGANPNDSVGKDSVFELALYQYSRQCQQAKVIELLLENGANPFVKLRQEYKLKKSKDKMPRVKKSKRGSFWPWIHSDAQTSKAEAPVAQVCMAQASKVQETNEQLSQEEHCRGRNSSVQKIRRSNSEIMSSKELNSEQLRKLIKDKKKELVRGKAGVTPFPSSYLHRLSQLLAAVK